MEVLVTACCGPGGLKGSHLDCSLEGHKRAGFSHSNFPSWPQFGLVIFFKSVVTKILFHLGFYSGKNSQFSRVFIKNQPH